MIKTNVPLVTDSMVFLHLGFVKQIPDFLRWFDPPLIITPSVIREVERVSKEHLEFGYINLNTHVEEKILNKVDLSSGDETEIFYGYYNYQFGKKKFGQGESSCLAVSLANGYGLICDEAEVRAEFNEEKKKRKFEAPGYTTRQILQLAKKNNLISADQFNDFEKALF